MLTYVVLGGIYFVRLHRLLRHLRAHHSEWWQALGSPSPALFPSPMGVARSTVHFIRERQYERVGDARVIALAERVRNSLRVAFACFCVMMTAILIAMVFA
jgi:hypothetical protein